VEKMAQSSDSESASQEDCSAAPSERAGSVVSLSAPSSVESQTDSVMECLANDGSSSPDHQQVSDSPNSPALLEKPWVSFTNNSDLVVILGS
jgi:hypothetical protein